MGKPAAAQGLFIRTVRPSFRYITRATAHPSDPLVKVEFRPDGTVEQVHLEQSSGNERVDRAITDAVFMWTAEGERLEKLVEGETTSILLRISL
jgi:TonB family protein